MRPLFVPILLFVTLWCLQSYAAEPTCSLQVPASRSLRDIEIRNCEQVKASPACQDLYKKIKEDGGNVSEKALLCETDHDASVVEAVSVSYIGCLRGGIDMIQNLGKFLGETTAKAVQALRADADRQKYCDQHPEMKSKMFTTYNSSVPSLLQVRVPSERKLVSTSCAQLETDLYFATKQKEKFALERVYYKLNQENPQATDEEKQYLAWEKKKAGLAVKSDQGLINMVGSALYEMGIPYKCYNRETSWALGCEMAFGLGVPGGAYKGTLAALSGLKVSRFVKTAKALEAEAGSLKAISKVDQLSVLSKADKLSAEERIGAAEKLLPPASGTSTRVLSDFQKQELTDIHNIGAAGRSAGRPYTGQEVQAKLKRLKAAGFSKEDREILMRNGITGDFDDYVKASLAAQAKDAEAYAKMEDLERRKIQTQSRLKDPKLGAKEKAELETSLSGDQQAIEKYRTSIFGGDAIGPGFGPVDLARIERRVGAQTRDLELAEATGGKTTQIVENRARTLRESAEFKATGKQYGEAQKDFKLAATDVERALAEGGLQTTNQKIQALRILQNAGPGEHLETYNRLLSQVSESAAAKAGTIKAESLTFGDPAINPVVINQQRGSIWEQARQVKDQSLRIELQRVRNEVTSGHKWEQSGRLDQQFQRMVDQRAQLQQALEQRVYREYGSNTSGAHRALEQLGVGN